MIAMIWDHLNDPLPVLLIGSGLGWLFLKIGWEPYQRRKARNEEMARFRTEAEIRLAEVSYRLRKGSMTSTAVKGSPVLDVFVSPELRFASLFALIAGGWGVGAAHRWHEDIGGLELSEEQRKDDATRRQAQDTVSHIAKSLAITFHPDA